MSSSSNYSSFSIGFQPKVLSKPMCDHELPTDILTSHTEENSGRRYFCCPIRKWDDCDYWQWIDFPNPISFCRNSCDRRLQDRLKAEKEKYEAQLQCKALLEELLSEKLQQKTEECEALKFKLKEAIIEAEAHKKFVWFVLKGVVVSAVMVAFACRFV